MKYKTKILIMSVACILILSVSCAVAFLTGDDRETNTFTLGSVEVDVVEPLWDALPDDNDNGIKDAAESIWAEKTIQKDVAVKNTGTNAAYVAVTVKVPKGYVSTYEDSGLRANGGKRELVQLFTYTVNSGWTLRESVTSGVDFNYYNYYYNTKLMPNQTTINLFDSVTFAKIIEGETETSRIFDIQIQAFAIQADIQKENGTIIANVDEAMTYLDNAFVNSQFDYTEKTSGGVTTVTIIGYKGSADEIVFPQKINGHDVTVIGDGTKKLTGISMVKSVILPDSVITIKNNAFNGCSGIRVVALNDSLETIATNAFKNCSGLLTIRFPASTISNLNSFSGCTSVRNVYVSAGTGIGRNYSSVNYAYTPWAASEAAGVDVFIESGVQSIGEYTFYSCDTIRGNVDIPSSCTKISKSAFKDTSASSITIYNPTCDIYYKKTLGVVTHAITETTKILGYSGSTAETYANTDGNAFEVIF